MAEGRWGGRERDYLGGGAQPQPNDVADKQRLRTTANTTLKSRVRVIGDRREAELTFVIRYTFPVAMS